MATQQGHFRQARRLSTEVNWARFIETIALMGRVMAAPLMRVGIVLLQELRGRLGVEWATCSGYVLIYSEMTLKQIGCMRISRVGAIRRRDRHGCRRLELQVHA